MTEKSFHELDFISYQDFLTIRSKLEPGEGLLVECVEKNKFTVSTGKFKRKHVEIVGRLKPGTSSHEFDTQGNLGKPAEKMRTKSLANPAVIFGFKSSWEEMVRSPVNRTDIAVDWFMEKLDGLIQQEFSDMGNPDRFDKRVTWDLFEKKYHEGYQDKPGKWSYRIVHKEFSKVVEITILDFYRKGSDMTVGFSSFGNALYFVYDGKFSQL
jgi:hypothetical protein